MQSLPTHSGDTLDDYDTKKFKEKKDKKRKGTESSDYEDYEDSSSSDDEEMPVRSTFSMLNKNTVLRNERIRKEPGY